MKHSPPFSSEAPIDGPLVLDIASRNETAPVTGGGAPTVTGYITRWTVAGDGAARTISLPLVDTRAEGPLNYYCTVDWGDGSLPSTVTAYDDTSRIHTYAADGTYDVEIRGTCEGWSFGNAGDKLKIVAVVSWGDVSRFLGFKYLKGGFFGCANLVSIGAGPILASGTGVLSEGFKTTFTGCSALASISADLFRYHTSVSTEAFDQTFAECVSLTSIPVDLFRYNTLASSYGFYVTFRNCVLFTSIPTDLFRYNTLVSDHGFIQTFFGCTSLTSIPADLFRYNTLVSASAFAATFYGCTALTSIPVDLFRYNTLVSTDAFAGTFFGCTALATIPVDLFRYNTLVSTGGFRATFFDCISLTSVPANLFRYNTLVSTTGFFDTFHGCVKLSISPDIWYQPGEQATRFLNLACDFREAFIRSTFTGVQGTAPDLWNCDYGEYITLDVSPTVDWAPGDTITGQSSGATAVVVAKLSGDVTYHIYKHFGTFTLGEVVGVTGVPNKLADQGAANPIFAGTPVSVGCFGGAGNSLASISNYADIPASWK